MTPDDDQILDSMLDESRKGIAVPDLRARIEAEVRAVRAGTKAFEYSPTLVAVKSGLSLRTWIGIGLSAACTVIGIGLLVFSASNTGPRNEPTLAGGEGGGTSEAAALAASAKERETEGGKPTALLAQDPASATSNSFPVVSKTAVGIVPEQHPAAGYESRLALVPRTPTSKEEGREELSVERDAAVLELVENEAVEVEVAESVSEVDPEDSTRELASSRAYLGISVKESENDEGVVITEVHVPSAADAIGLRVKDLILRVDGETFSTSEALVAHIAARSPGDRVKLRILRASIDPEGVFTQNTTFDIDVTLGKKR